MKTPIWTIFAILIATGASAQQKPADKSTDRPTDGPIGRFQLERTEQGLVRLDTETGAMTLCRDENGTLACRMQPDERAAYDQELDRLAKRVTALEQKLGQTPPQALSKAPSTSLPSDAEVDRSISIMERFMRSFMAIVREFSDERDKQPDRT